MPSPITVDIPGVGSVDFPDTMNPDQINAAAKQLHDQANPPPSLARRVGRLALDTLPGIGGIVGGVLSTPETLGTGTIPGVALGIAAGQGARDLIGHATGLDTPSTPLQKTGRIVRAGVEAAVLPGLFEAARTPIQTLRDAGEQFGSAMPPAIRRLGRILPSLPQQTGPTLQRPPWQTWEQTPPPAPEAGRIMSGPMAQAPARAGLSAADRAALVQRYGPNIQAVFPKMEAQIVPVASHPVSMPPEFQPVDAPVASAPPATPSPAGVSPIRQAELQQRFGGTAESSSPLRQPRVDIGAERVGRQAGMSTQDVRTATGPVLGEAPGAASPILPRNAMNNIVDRLVSMGPKGAGGPESARDAYVMAANSDKARAQIQAYLDALRKVGFGGAGALSVREALLRQMPSHAPSNGQTE